MSSAASLRSSSDSPPAIWAESRSRTWATSVSRSSPRSVTSRTRAASVRTAGQRRGARFTSTLRASALRPGRTPSSSAARWSADVSGAKAESTAATRLVNAPSWPSAIAIARSVVKSYCGSTLSRAAGRAWVVSSSLVKLSARWATMSEVASSPARRSMPGVRSSPRIMVMTTTSPPNDRRRRVRSWRLGRRRAPTVACAVTRRLPHQRVPASRPG